LFLKIYREAGKGGWQTIGELHINGQSGELLMQQVVSIVKEKLSLALKKRVTILGTNRKVLPDYFQTGKMDIFCQNRHADFRLEFLSLDIK
jgi:hypothetical protein